MTTDAPEIQPSTEGMPREFVFNGQKLADPDDDMTPDMVRRIYSKQFPALTNATISAPVVADGKAVYTFGVVARTKG